MSLEGMRNLLKGSEALKESLGLLVSVVLVVYYDPDFNPHLLMSII